MIYSKNYFQKQISLISSSNHQRLETRFQALLPNFPCSMSIKFYKTPPTAACSDFVHNPSIPPHGPGPLCAQPLVCAGPAMSSF